MNETKPRLIVAVFYGMVALFGISVLISLFITMCLGWPESHNLAQELASAELARARLEVHRDESDSVESLRQEIAALSQGAPPA